MKKLRIAVFVSLMLALVVTWGGLIVTRAWPHMIQGNTGNALVTIVIAVTLVALALNIVYTWQERRSRKRFDNPS